MNSFFKAILIVAILIAGHAARAGDDSKAYKERVQALIQMRLSQNLGLNATQTAQVGQIMRKYQDRRHVLRKEVKGLNQQLRTATASGNEADIQKLVATSNRARLDLEQLDGQMFNEVRPMLNPRQQAQFLIEMDEIRSEIRAIRRGSKGAGEGGYNVPAGAFSNNPNYFPPGVPAKDAPTK